MWRIFVNMTTDGARERVENIDLGPTRTGWVAAADQIDAALAEHGWVRSAPWTIGSGNGIVTWLDIDTDRLIDEVTA